MNKELKELLYTDSNRNIATIGFFKNYPILDFFIENNSALIYGTSNHLWTHIISSSEKELESLLEKHHTKTSFYYSVEDWMIPLILKYGKEDWRMTTHRYVLDNGIPIDPPKTKIIKLNASHASIIYENSDYKEFISIDYTKQRISKDISAGIMINNELIAWGFTHDDGALGFLHVLESHRRMGFGKEILLGLGQMRKNEKKPIFGNIIPENKASINLVSKLSFKFDRKVSWISLK
jgi:8-oxo-dGTP diphosphatase